METTSTSTSPPTTAGTPTTTPPQSTLQGVDRSSFSTFIDFREFDEVADAARSIVPLLEERVTDNSLFYLPPGRYLMGETWNIADFENVAIVGDDATIVVPPGFSDNLFSPGPENASGFHLEGLTFDFQYQNTGGRVLHAKVADDLTIRDVTVRGALDVVDNVVRIDVTDPDGSALVERLDLPDGAPTGTGAVGVLVGGTNRGDIRFQDCHIDGFPNNALYASPEEGTMEVFGGTYANSAIANVRIRGDSHVRGVHVRCDRAPEGFRNMRGIRIHGGSNVVVEDCTVEMLDATYSDGAIVVSTLTDGATIRNTHVRTDAENVVGLRAKPAVDGSNPDASLDVENVTFSGSAQNGSAIRVVERDNVNVRDVCIQASGANRNGIELTNAHGIRIEDAYIDVTEEPVVAERSEYVTSNVQTPSTGDPSEFC